MGGLGSDDRKEFDDGFDHRTITNGAGLPMARCVRYSRDLRTIMPNIRRSFGSKASSSRASGQFLPEPYKAPSWARSLQSVPEFRLRLGQFPTPIHRWLIPGAPQGTEVYIKREDWSGMDLGGNKVRKLEFLLADALSRECETVITIGGTQSNHCRSTAVASRLLGMDPHVILRRDGGDQDGGWDGNMLFMRLCDTDIHLVSRQEYGREGSDALLSTLSERLERDGRRPYSIPVGGSNALGTWGYVEFVEELLEQSRGLTGNKDGFFFDKIVLATGSGGTAAGIALGVDMCGIRGCTVDAYGVCDSPSYFYDQAAQITSDMGHSLGTAETISAGNLLRVTQAKGRGYAVSTPCELETVARIAGATGVSLDPVYSGKAVNAMLGSMRDSPDEWKDKRVLFVHTGGFIGMHAKIAQLKGIHNAGRVHNLL